MVLTNKEVHEKTKTEELGCFISDLQHKFIVITVRAPNSNQNKMLLFNQYKKHKKRTKTSQPVRTSSESPRPKPRRVLLGCNGGQDMIARHFIL